jgi:hypothetical protein
MTVGDKHLTDIIDFILQVPVEHIMVLVTDMNGAVPQMVP